LAVFLFAIEFKFTYLVTYSKKLRVTEKQTDKQTDSLLSIMLAYTSQTTTLRYRLRHSELYKIASQKHN